METAEFLSGPGWSCRLGSCRTAPDPMETLGSVEYETYVRAVNPDQAARGRRHARASGVT